MAIAPPNNMTEGDYELLQNDLSLDELYAITGTKEHILRAKRMAASKKLLEYVERNMYVLGSANLEKLKQLAIDEQQRRRNKDAV